MGDTFRVTTAAPELVVFTRGGESLSESYGANAAALIGSRGVLLLDPFIAPSEARRVEEALRELTGAPLLGVVLTHHHTDHALGAGLFACRGVPVFATRACAEAMRAQHPAILARRRADPALAPLFAGAAAYVPSRLVETEETVDLGGFAAHLRAAGHAHTPGDLVVEVPEMGFLLTGDLVSNGYHVNYEEADPAGYERALEPLLAGAWKYVVPGHGAPGGPELLERALATHRETRTLVESALAEGLDEAAAVRRLEGAFPEHLLRGVLPDTVRAFSAARS